MCWSFVAPGYALVNTAQVAITELERCGFELLPHVPYSTDLALSDF